MTGKPDYFKKASLIQACQRRPSPLIRAPARRMLRASAPKQVCRPKFPARRTSGPADYSIAAAKGRNLPEIGALEAHKRINSLRISLRSQNSETISH
ncbi:hypothetical protein [Bradyrhizobium sp. USDA 10063]